MNVPIILAHGALGSFDEVIFISVVMVFVVLMIFSWLRSRNLPDDADEVQELRPTRPSTDPTLNDPTDDDHFSLE
ncbi:hypothetical protein G4Y79_08850 [Phototrophicus methaneseepsis]|uniref:Uncharacterized protein n=1 Tax=Phototrophicus methaneseepsis TaxID=2710758 RepID=A0A7S8ECJ9_9CHLR|nr:hypothetical protein [Phototrophicus methaneseepsis]QPC84467.1 hypothetical protein G4Y79_08850 [Phototrophicus methaneseepsis]